jgi:uncharacterized protein (PEP-CTERM system associated)
VRHFLAARLRAGLWLWPLWCAPAVHAQAGDAAGGGPPPPLRIEPYIALTQTISHASPGRTVSATQLAPGISMSAQRGRVRGYLNYSLGGLAYGSSGDEDFKLRHSLDAAGTAEVIENRLYVDASATVSQRTISAFGLQTPDPVLPNANQTQVVTLNVSPRLRGRLFGDVEYNARVSHSMQRAGQGEAFDSDITNASLGFSGGTGLRAVSWSLDLLDSTYDIGTARTTRARSARAQVNYAITDSLRVSAIGGREWNNFTSIDLVPADIVGWAVDWRPSPRTRLYLTQEDRFFGTGHQVIAEYRMPRTTFSFTSARNISTPQEQLALAAIGTVFDLFFQQFAALEPDPIARRALVLNFLLANGVAPNTPVFGSFLTSGLTLANTQQLSATWRALRGSASLAFTQSSSRRLVAFASAPDDFSNTSVVKQRGFVASYNHRLTPISSLLLSASFTQSRGEISSLGTSLRALQATYSAQVNPKLSGSLSARISSFSGVSDSNTEYALIGSVAMRY